MVTNGDTQLRYSRDANKVVDEFDNTRAFVDGFFAALATRALQSASFSNS